MKGYEIFKGIANKEIKDGTQFRMLKDDNIYTYRNNNLVCRYGELNVIKILNQEFEIIEDKEDTNIKELTYKGLLDLYNKEKEKNKKYKNKIKAVLELIDTKPYTAYTLYGDILYDDEDIRKLLKERND